MPVFEIHQPVYLPRALLTVAHRLRIDVRAVVTAAVERAIAEAQASQPGGGKAPAPATRDP